MAHEARAGQDGGRRRKGIGFGGAKVSVIVPATAQARMASMASPPAQISVIAPIQPAIERAKSLLFQPFDLGTWFTIGFCAWLAGFGQMGFTWTNRFPFSGGFQTPGSAANWQGASESWERAKDEVTRNLGWIVPLAIALVCLVVVLGVLAVWLTSRGEFMFLHCVALGRAEIAVPWRQHARKARSLFFFRLALGLLAAVVMLLLFAIIGVVVFRIVKQGAAQPADWLPLVAVGLALLVFGVAFGVVAKLTRDLVVPIMFVRDGTCRQAWSELLGLFAGGIHLLIIYLLFQIVLAMAIGVVVLAAMIVTCCIAGCLLIIPYIGTVLLLPVLVFARSYSLYYLAQLGPQYDLFQPAAPPPTGPA